MLTGAEVYARYGSTIAALGDLNRDGYNGEPNFNLFVSSSNCGLVRESSHFCGDLAKESPQKRKWSWWERKCFWRDVLKHVEMVKCVYIFSGRIMRSLLFLMCWDGNTHLLLSSEVLQSLTKPVIKCLLDFRLSKIFVNSVLVLGYYFSQHWKQSNNWSLTLELLSCKNGIYRKIILIRRISIAK